jgi:hypothetical protein
LNPGLTPKVFLFSFSKKKSDIERIDLPFSFKKKIIMLTLSLEVDEMYHGDKGLSEGRFAPS